MTSARPCALGLDGMVATGHPLATAAGLEMLASGGNAVDAALAAAAATWVTLPMMCGPGGDAFALVWDPKRREAVGFGGGGTAPAAANPEWFRERGHRLIPLQGPLSVGVPGCLAVMEEMARRFGSRDWDQIFAFAARLADDGFPISARVAGYFEEYADAFGRRPPQPGEVFRQRDLARTIETIAAGGADALYRGELGEAIVRHLEQLGGLLSLDDLAAERADVYSPPSIDYRGWRVHQTAPPSQGFVVLEELAILEADDLSNPESADAIHLMVEAKKLAVADRNRYAGDPRQVHWDLDELLSKEHAARLRRRLDPARAASAQQPAVAGDTTYLCAADRDGRLVSFVHSLSLAFGAGIQVPGTGIWLNDRAGRGFTLAEGHPNRIAPGKRTMSTLNAYLVSKDGQARLAGGTPGGDGQVQWNLQVLAGLLDAGRDPQAAAEAPRWTHGPTTDPWRLGTEETLVLEERFGEEVLLELRRRGHPARFDHAAARRGSVQVIERAEDGVLRGGSDPRGEGLAAGR